MQGFRPDYASRFKLEHTVWFILNRPYLLQLYTVVLRIVGGFWSPSGTGDLTEAAQNAGRITAGPRFRRITLPLLRPAILGFRPAGLHILLYQFRRGPDPGRTTLCHPGGGNLPAGRATCSTCPWPRPFPWSRSGFTFIIMMVVYTWPWDAGERLGRGSMPEVFHGPERQPSRYRPGRERALHLAIHVGLMFLLLDRAAPGPDGPLHNHASTGLVDLEIILPCLKTATSSDILCPARDQSLAQLPGICRTGHHGHGPDSRTFGRRRSWPGGRTPPDSPWHGSGFHATPVHLGRDPGFRLYHCPGPPAAESAHLDHAFVPLAHTLVAFPFVVRSACCPPCAAIPNRLREAASLLGASPWRVLADRVDLPIDQPGPAGRGRLCFYREPGGIRGNDVFVARPQTPDHAPGHLPVPRSARRR